MGSLFFVNLITMRKSTTILILFIFYTSSYSGDDKLFESFIDSTTIKEKLSFKVEFRRYGISQDEAHWVKVDFFKKRINKWQKVLSYQTDINQTHINKPELKDLNKDGYLDFSYVPFLTARGANELREHFIYDQDLNNYIHIKNSSHYPNLSYNEYLKGYNSFAFHGGTTQYFLSLELDTLIELASIEIRGLERELILYDTVGIVTMVKKDSLEEEGFPFYKNYNPIIELYHHKKH